VGKGEEWAAKPAFRQKERKRAARKEPTTIPVKRKPKDRTRKGERVFLRMTDPFLKKDGGRVGHKSLLAVSKMGEEEKSTRHLH